MHTSHSGVWLSSITAPLAERFGGNLTLSRAGNSVCWAYAGQSAIIEQRPDGSLRATFVDAPSHDTVSKSPVAAVYRGRSTYALDRTGCRHIVDDLVAFFSGVREPSFTFIDAYPR